MKNFGDGSRGHNRCVCLRRVRSSIVSRVIATPAERAIRFVPRIIDASLGIVLLGNAGERGSCGVFATKAEEPDVRVIESFNVLFTEAVAWICVEVKFVHRVNAVAEPNIAGFFSLVLEIIFYYSLHFESDVVSKSVQFPAE